MSEALESGGWVENRFRVVEERLARLEEGDENGWDDEIADDFAESLTSEGPTVGKLRTELAGFNPSLPLRIEVAPELSPGEFQTWTGNTLDREASTPLQAVYTREAIVKVGPQKDS